MDARDEPSVQTDTVTIAQLGNDAAPASGVLAIPASPPRRSHRSAIFLLVSDAVAMSVALLAGILAWEVVDFGYGAEMPSLHERAWTFGLVLLAVPFLASYRLYDNDRRRISVSGMGEFFSVFHALAVYGFILVLVLGATGGTDTILDTRELAGFFVAALVAVPIARALTRRIAIPAIARPQRTLIVGAGQVGQNVARKVAQRPDYNLQVIGFLDNEPMTVPDDLGLNVLGAEFDLVRVANEHNVERVILCFSRMSHEDILEIIRHSGLEKLYVSVVPRYFEIMASNVEVDDVAGIPVLDLQPVRLSRVAMISKRAMDLSLTLLALPVLVPAILAIALAVKLDSRGPIFFRQARMGRGGSAFRIFKFRTMVVDAELRRAELLHRNEVTGPLFKLKDDPRVTRVGAFLRRTSLDELPQLINVIRGEMSLVGPRPFVTYEAEEIRGWARRRVDVTPGITGVWQVMGRNDMPFEEMIKFDYLYVTNWSLGWDLKLLIQTIPSVLGKRGAY